MHVKGEENVVADTVSRHLTTDPDDDDDVTVPLGKWSAYCISGVPTAEEDEEATYTSELLLAVEDLEEESVCALSPKVIAHHQDRDKELQKKFKKSKSIYETIELEDEELIAYNGKVVVPETLQDKLIDQYHGLLNHPGMTRMEVTIR